MKLEGFASEAHADLPPTPTDHPGNTVAPDGEGGESDMADYDSIQIDNITVTVVVDDGLQGVASQPHAVSQQIAEPPLETIQEQATLDTVSDIDSTASALDSNNSKETDNNTVSTSAGSGNSTRSSRSTVSLGTRVRTGSPDVADHVRNIASFDGCEGLLRGSRVSDILRNRARVFSDDSAGAAAYALSKPVPSIDVFISHNWCVPRWQKWLCLIFHFNLKIAMVMTFVAVSPVGVIAAYGWVPICHPEFARYPRSYVFRLIIYPVWLALLCFCRDIFCCFSAWSPIVFLDKTCIHQEDKVLQRQGIEKVGAHLCYSKTLVICYSEMYLRKLWTVYEMASFMTLQSTEQLKVIPVNFPVVFIMSMTSMWLGGAIALWPELAFGVYYTAHIVFLVTSNSVMFVFRMWSRSKLDMYRKILAFDVRKCLCLCEDDRPLVYANIAALMKEIQDIGNDASEDAALASFDNLVRNNLGGALISSVGKYAMRYEHAAAVGCGFFAPVLDQLVGLAHGMPVRELCSYTLWYATLSLFIIPAALMGFSMWAEQSLRITGWRENVYLVLGTVVVIAITMIFRAILDLMEAWANKSDLGFLFFFLFFVISSSLVRNEIDGSFCCKSGHAKYQLAASEDVPHKVPLNPDNFSATVPQASTAVRHTETIPQFVFGRALLAPREPRAASR